MKTGEFGAGTGSKQARSVVNQLRIIYAGGEQTDQEALDVIVKASGIGDVRVLVAPEAVAEILAHRVDVLIVDVKQPSQDVLSLMRTATLTNVRRPVPVIVTGSQDAGERIEACLQRGATDYLITPFDAKHPSLVVAVSKDSAPTVNRRANWR